MGRNTVTEYGLGGFDPAKPNSNVVERYEVDVPDYEPTIGERLAALEAEVKGMKERAAAEAGKASPTAKGVAQAVTGPTT